MKKILVIDDVRVMNFDCTYARTSKEAISVLESDWTWDELWWDHDLGGEYGRFDRYDTVMPVVTWFEENIFFGNKPAIGLMVIHTANPPGRKVINAVMSRHYRVRHADADDYCIGFIQ